MAPVSEPIDVGRAARRWLIESPHDRAFGITRSVLALVAAARPHQSHRAYLPDRHVVAMSILSIAVPSSADAIGALRLHWVALRSRRLVTPHHMIPLG